MTNHKAMNVDLDGQVALVTGAGRGIGAVIARILAENGAKVVFADLELNSALESAAGVVRGMPLAMNVADEREVDAGIARIDREFGRLDILVNNAGVGPASGQRLTIDKFSPAEWERILKVDLTGVFLVSRAAAQVMVRQKRGRIVNISSVMGVVPARLQCAYTASKAGVVSLTRATAIELAKDGVLANCVAPGTMENVYRGASDLKAFGQRILDHVPIGRPGAFEDIAYAVLYFASPDNSYVTGQTLCVDGGWTAGGFVGEF